MTESASPGLDVIIPVHNQLQVLRPCLESVLRWTDPAAARVSVIADACDARTLDYAGEWCGRFGAARVLTSERRLGFVLTCNRGLRASSAEAVVLLNSDTCVTPRWGEKLVTCLASDPAIGVASPLSNFAPHLQISMLPGSDHLQMAALVEATWDGRYPDVTTPEGFCYAIHARCLAAVGYLDEAYGEGYGEESDFALRASYLGFRTVCATNTYVYHRGRATYGPQRRDELYKASRRVFNARWRNKYPQEVEEFRRRDTVAGIRQRLVQAWDTGLEPAFKRPGQSVSPKRVRPTAIPRADPAGRWRPADALRVLFVLPTLNPYGGVVSVANHVNDLIDAGHRVTLLSLSRIATDLLFLRTEPVYLPADSRIADLLADDFDVLVATSWETVRYVRDAAERMPSALPIYYVQDLEADFFPGPDAAIKDRVLATYGMLPHRVVKTRYLQGRLAELGWDSYLIPPGMELDLFYPRPVARRATPVVLAMARPGAPADIRGCEVLREVYRLLKAARGDLELMVFGTASLPPDFPRDVDLGILARDRLPETYSLADVFVETSRVHGFGRCGAEAMACHTACVLSASGGVSEYARDGDNALLVPVGDASATVAAVLRLVADQDLRSRLGQAGAESIGGFASQRSTGALLDLVHRLRSETGRDGRRRAMRSSATPP